MIEEAKTLTKEIGESNFLYLFILSLYFLIPMFPKMYEKAKPFIISLIISKVSRQEKELRKEVEIEEKKIEEKINKRGMEKLLETKIQNLIIENFLAKLKQIYIELKESDKNSFHNQMLFVEQTANTSIQILRNSFSAQMREKLLDKKIDLSQKEIDLHENYYSHIIKNSINIFVSKSRSFLKRDNHDSKSEVEFQKAKDVQFENILFEIRDFLIDQWPETFVMTANESFKFIDEKGDIQKLRSVHSEMMNKCRTIQIQKAMNSKKIKEEFNREIKDKVDVTFKI